MYYVEGRAFFALACHHRVFLSFFLPFRSQLLLILLFFAFFAHLDQNRRAVCNTFAPVASRSHLAGLSTRLLLAIIQV